jgi:IS5 family transposase
MRQKFEEQLQLGQIDIGAIEFDLRSRDEIPKLLIGLQHIFTTPSYHDKVFEILESVIPEEVDKRKGRPGMDLWEIFVLASLRVNCNCNFDKIHEMANQHKTLRLMLGRGIFDTYGYSLQSIKDNFALLTPSVLRQLGELVVKAAHDLLPVEETAQLKGQCDSFVVETNVEYPTNNNLLFNAIRKAITLVARLCFGLHISGWRQWQHQVSTIKSLYNGVRKLRRSTSENEKKKTKRDEEIRDAYTVYLRRVEALVPSIESSLERAKEKVLSKPMEVRKVWNDKIEIVEGFVNHVKRQVGQIRRRIFRDEKIPHSEKIFSVFETQTEWINKGKAGISQELGLRVAILKDQFGLVLNHRVMRGQTDEKVAVSITRKAKELFVNLTQCSYDKGFWCPSNLTELKAILATVILPKKGRLSKADKERQSDLNFIEGRRYHPAVESAINALENHGLDRCPDRGEEAFDRYVAVAVVARNVQLLGHLIQQKRLKEIRKARLEAAEQQLFAA